MEGQDDIIVSDAGEIFQGIHILIADMIKILTRNCSMLLNHKKAIVKIQDDAKVWREAQQSLENKVEDMEKHM